MQLTKLDYQIQEIATLYRFLPGMRIRHLSLHRALAKEKVFFIVTTSQHAPFVLVIEFLTIPIDSPISICTIA